MKCCAKLTTAGSCGQQARFDFLGHPYCRRHLSERILVTVLQSPSLSAQIGVTKL
jgi:hypothetical protein